MSSISSGLHRVPECRVQSLRDANFRSAAEFLGAWGGAERVFIPSGVISLTMNLISEQKHSSAAEFSVPAATSSAADQRRLHTSSPGESVRFLIPQSRDINEESLRSSLTPSFI